MSRGRRGLGAEWVGGGVSWRRRGLAAAWSVDGLRCRSFFKMLWDDFTTTYVHIIIALSIACLQTAFRLKYFTRKVVHRGTQIEEPTTDDSSDDDCDANKTLRSLHVSLTPPNSPHRPSMS